MRTIISRPYANSNEDAEWDSFDSSHKLIIVFREKVAFNDHNLIIANYRNVFAKLEAIDGDDDRNLTEYSASFYVGGRCYSFFIMVNNETNEILYKESWIQVETHTSKINHKREADQRLTKTMVLAELQDQ